MKKETYSAPVIEDVDPKMLAAGIGTGSGMSTPDPDDNTGDI